MYTTQAQLIAGMADSSIHNPTLLLAELGYVYCPFAKLTLVLGWQMAKLGDVNYPFAKLSLVLGWQMAGLGYVNYLCYTSSAYCRDGRWQSWAMYCILSFCQAQLSAGMADGRARLCKLSSQAQFGARMADGRVGLCILYFG